jgi:hypothetical protein
MGTNMLQMPQHIMFMLAQNLRWRLFAQVHFALAIENYRAA